MRGGFVRFAAALVIALLAGCGADAVPDGPQLTRGNGAEPESLDIHKSRSESSANILRDLYEGLVAQDADGTLVPGVAESWRTSADGLRWDFTLRDDARWSTGEPVVASDFVYAFRRLVLPATGAAYAQMLDPLANADAIAAGNAPPESLGVEAPNDRTLVLKLRYHAPYLPGVLTHPSTFPLHRASMAQHGDAFSRPGNLVSNGAYVLSEWVVGLHVAATRNGHYWRDDVRIDRVRYVHLADANAELNRFRAGELDITYTVPSAQLDMVRGKHGDALHVAPVLNTYFYGFNLTRPPFKDAPELRRALSMAVNRELLVERITGAGEVPAYGLVPPGVHNYTPQQPGWADQDMVERLAEARRLYAAAGYDDENPLEIEIRYNTGQLHQRIAVAIAAMWEGNLGARVTLYNEEWKVFLRNRRGKRVTEVFRAGWIGDYNDAWTYAQLLDSTSPLNDTGYASAEYEATLNAAAAETRPAERRRLLEHAERLMLVDQPLMPLFFYVSKHLVSPRVTGWQAHVMDHHDTRHLGLEERAE